MTGSPRVIQIVPHAPGERDGVADYAQTLARRLREIYGMETVFVPNAPVSVASTPDRFAVLPSLRTLSTELPESARAVILHYVNYGYSSRGIPGWLPRVIRSAKGPRTLLTIFHELYARGLPWQSAFWLRPLQRRIARSLAALSDFGLVSSECSKLELCALAPESRVLVHPVPSNFGEPNLSSAQLNGRDPRRWIICGGKELVERSLLSFLQNARRIEPARVPRELFVVGGSASDKIRDLTKKTRFDVTYHPEIEAEAASAILSTCSYGWIDYFVQGDLPLAMILKSSAFAALCAHGVIAVTPHRDAEISHRGDRLPGPFFIARDTQSLPSSSDQDDVAGATYAWYQRNARSPHLAKIIHDAFAFSA
jgi:hypothetical protein